MYYISEKSDESHTNYSSRIVEKWKYVSDIKVLPDITRNKVMEVYIKML